MSQLLFPGRRMMWMDPAGVPASFAPGGAKFCCAEMTMALTNVCDQHQDDPFACPDMLVAYSPAFDEYGLIIHDGGPSFVTIGHCPWCGTKLPESQRDRWFDELEAQGFDDPLSGDIPEAYKSAAWRSGGK